MGTGINISRSNDFVFRPISLGQLLTIIEDEIGKTKNSLFGRVNLEGLDIRIKARIVAQMAENK